MDVNEITLDLVWNGKINKNHKFIPRDEIEKALNTEVNIEKIKTGLFLVEGPIDISMTSMIECKMENVIGSIISIDLDNYKATIKTHNTIDELFNYQLAFKMIGCTKFKDNMTKVFDISIQSCYIIHKNMSARID